MDRKELITSPEFVIGEMDTELFNKLGDMMRCLLIRDYNKIMRAEFCEKSAVINRLVETCLINGFIPVLKLIPVAEYIAEDERKAKEVRDGNQSDKVCYKCGKPATHTYGGSHVCTSHFDKLNDQFDEEYR